VVTRWNFGDSYSREFFGPARYAIRDAMNARHIAEDKAKTSRQCQFRMINSASDKTSAVEFKQAQCDLLNTNGFDAKLKIVHEADVDGKVVKSLAHGLNASMSGIYDLYADSFAVIPTTLDRKLGTSLSFECYDYVYRIKHSDETPFFQASCERN
jgi:hypothetical protein